MKSTSINCDELIDSYHDIAVSEFRVHDVVSIISVHDVLNIVSYVFEKGEVCLQGNAKDPIENEHIKTTYLDYDD